VPRRLLSAGIEYSTALSMIGKFSGMAMAIIFFPLIVVNSMSTVLIPDLSQSLDKKDYFALENRITGVLKIAFVLGLSTLVICISIPDSLGNLFFNRNDLGDYIKFASLAAPITFTSATTFGILNGLGRQGIVLRNSIIVSLLEVICLYIFTGIQSINIFGFGITLLITTVILFALNLNEIKKHCYISVPKGEFLIYILLSILVYFIINIANRSIPDSIFTLKIILIISFSFISFLFTSVILSKEK
jgi:stage V sporulation protein B